MARCLGADPPYGCKHFAEHQQAARKGWIKRRAEEEENASAVFGQPVEKAHEHPEHKGKVRYKIGDKWYETSRADFNYHVSEGLRLRKEQKAQETYEARETRRLARAREMEYHDVVRAIRRAGGIRPLKASSAGGKAPEQSEYRHLPGAVKNSRSRAAIDDMASTIEEEFPHIGVHSGIDLYDYLTRQHEKTHPFVRPV